MCWCCCCCTYMTRSGYHIKEKRWDGSESVWCDKIDADHFYLILYLDESSNAFCQFRRIENKIGSFFEWVIRVVVVFAGIIRCSMRISLFIWSILCMGVKTTKSNSLTKAQIKQFGFKPIFLLEIDSTDFKINKFFE